MKKDFIDKLVTAVKSGVEAGQEKDNQYVVEYRNAKTDELIGYHGGTFCVPTDNRLDAKRYSGDNPYNQLATINKNLNFTLGCTEDNPGFAKIPFGVKMDHFPDFNPGDISLVADYLEDGIPKQTFEFKIV